MNKLRANAASLSHLAIYLAPLFLAIAIMIPRIASAQFGLLDDGVTLQTARKIGVGDWDIWDFGNRRSRPFHWVYLYLVDLLSGSQARGFFIANTILLLALTALVMLVVFRFTGRSNMTLMTGTIFVLSSPVIESYYTLSKGEPLQLIFLLLAILIMLPNKAVSGVALRLLRIVAAALLLFLSMGTKETSLVILPVSVIWMLSLFVSKRKSNYLGFRALDFFIAASLATLSFLVMRQSLVGLSLIGSGYSDQYQFSIERLISSGARWAGWLIHDFLYLVPLLILLALIARFADWRSFIPLLLGAFVWITGWLAIYLFWIFIADYYLLPVAIAVSLMASMILVAALSAAKIPSNLKFTSYLLVALAVILWSLTLPNNYTMARQQLAIDKVNEGMVEYVAINAPPSTRVLLQIQADGEYTEELGIHLKELNSRTDVSVPSVSLTAEDAQQIEASTWVIVPLIENQVLFSPRLGLYELRVEEWRESVLPALAGNTEKIYSLGEKFRIFNINPPSLFCPIVDLALATRSTQKDQVILSMGRYCSRSPLLDLREFKYGWEVLQAIDS